MTNTAEQLFDTDIIQVRSDATWVPASVRLRIARQKSIEREVKFSASERKIYRKPKLIPVSEWSEKKPGGHIKFSARCLAQRSHALPHRHYGRIHLPRRADHHPVQSSPGRRL